MKNVLALSLFICLLLGGCATSKSVEQKQPILYTGANALEDLTKLHIMTYFAVLVERDGRDGAIAAIKFQMPQYSYNPDKIELANTLIGVLQKYGADKSVATAKRLAASYAIRLKAAYPHIKDRQIRTKMERELNAYETLIKN